MSKKVKEKIDELTKTLYDLKSFSDAFYDIKFCLERYEEYRQGLLRYAPFQIGDTVKIKKKIEINEHVNRCWYGYRHFLKVGTKGKVVDVDYSNTVFKATVEIQEKLFYIDEKYLKKV